MKRFLAGVALVALLVGVAWAAYTRDASGDGNVMITAAIEYLVENGIATSAPVAKTLTLVTKAVTTSGTGVPLMASETFARKVYLMAKKATGANTGLVYIGTSTVDATTPQQIALAPGETIVIDPGPGCKVDLATIYIDCAAANTDGVTGWYIPI